MPLQNDSFFRSCECTWRFDPSPPPPPPKKKKEKRKKKDWLKHKEFLPVDRFHSHKDLHFLLFWEIKLPFNWNKQLSFSWASCIATWQLRSGRIPIQLSPSGPTSAPLPYLSVVLVIISDNYLITELFYWLKVLNRQNNSALMAIVLFCAVNENLVFLDKDSVNIWWREA